MLNPEQNITQIIKILNSKDIALPFLVKHKTLKDVVKQQKLEIEQHKLEIEHLRYKPGGPEFEKTKAHFLTLASQ